MGIQILWVTKDDGPIDPEDLHAYLVPIGAEVKFRMTERRGDGLVAVRMPYDSDESLIIEALTSRRIKVAEREDRTTARDMLVR